MRRGYDVLIENSFDSPGPLPTTAGKFADAGCRIEVVAWPSPRLTAAWEWSTSCIEECLLRYNTQLQHSLNAGHWLPRADRRRSHRPDCLTEWQIASRSQSHGRTRTILDRLPSSSIATSDGYSIRIRNQYLGARAGPGVWQV